MAKLSPSSNNQPLSSDELTALRRDLLDLSAATSAAALRKVGAAPGARVKVRTTVRPDRPLPPSIELVAELIAPRAAE